MLILIYSKSCISYWLGLDRSLCSLWKHYITLCMFLSLWLSKIVLQRHPLSLQIGRGVLSVYLRCYESGCQARSSFIRHCNILHFKILTTYTEYKSFYLCSCSIVIKHSNSTKHCIYTMGVSSCFCSACLFNFSQLKLDILYCALVPHQ